MHDLQFKLHLLVHWLDVKFHKFDRQRRSPEYQRSLRRSQDRELARLSLLEDNLQFNEIKLRRSQKIELSPRLSGDAYIAEKDLFVSELIERLERLEETTIILGLNVL